MFFTEKQDIVLIANALLMQPGFQIQRVHTDRPYHCIAFHQDSVTEYRFSDGTVQTAGPGGVIFLPKGSSYTVRSLKSGSTWAVNFLVLSDAPESPFTMQPVNPAALANAFRELVTAAGNGRADSYRSRAALYLLFDLLAGESMAEERKRSGYSKIARAVEQLRLHAFLNDLPVSALAEMSGISEAYFRRIFKAYYGTSPADYVLDLKLQAASDRLISGDDGLEQIAADCGFYDAAHLCREFKKRRGRTPDKFRRENRL